MHNAIMVITSRKAKESLDILKQEVGRLMEPHSSTSEARAYDWWEFGGRFSGMFVNEMQCLKEQHTLRGKNFPEDLLSPLKAEYGRQSKAPGSLLERDVAVVGDFGPEGSMTVITPNGSLHQPPPEAWALSMLVATGIPIKPDTSFDIPAAVSQLRDWKKTLSGLAAEYPENVAVLVDAHS